MPLTQNAEAVGGFGSFDSPASRPGGSRDVDSARLISVFHTMNAALRANVWFEYVASAANIADLPSRNDFELLRSDRFVAEPFDIAWPPVDAWVGDFARLFQSYSSASAKGKRRRSC